MPERPILDLTKTEDYQRKSSLTAVIASGKGKPDIINPAILQLGDVLTTNDYLSNQQKDKLLLSLEDAELLHYCNDFDLERDDLDDPDSVLDGVRWELERNIKLQVAIISTTYSLSLSPKKEAIERLVALFNVGHNQASGGYEKHGLNYLAEYEESVFLNSTPLVENLGALHLIEPDDEKEVKELGNSDELRELGRWGQTYDRLIALYFYENYLDRDTPLNSFTSLQTLTYLGFAMGVRDINKREVTQELEYAPLAKQPQGLNSFKPKEI